MKRQTHTNDNAAREGIMDVTTDRMMQQRLDRRLRELASDLADLVESGDLTEQQANEWAADKADQWAF